MKTTFVNSLPVALVGPFLIAEVQGRTQQERAMPKTANPLAGAWRLVALFPNWVGGDQVREFRLEKDRLTSKTPPIRVGGEESTTVLVWQRVRWQGK